MKTNYFLVAIATLFIFSACPIVNAQDWPQFLGPDRNSKSAQKGILKSWPEGGPEVLWSVNVGIGYGGPVVKNNKVYLLDRDETGDIMRCFDLQNGKELWKFSYDAPGDIPFPGSRSVPVVDDKHVYSSGPYGDLYCFDINTQKVVWKKNIWKDYGGGNIPMWAISQCPVIYNDLLIVASQAPDAGVVAYNKLTGDVVWKTPNLGNVSYVSPKVLKIHGEDHVVWVASSTNAYTDPDAPKTKGKVVGLDPRTGKTLWTFADWECIISVPCPVEAGDNKLLIAGGYDRGATMIQVNKNGDGTFNTSELFTTLEFGDQTKPPLFHNGYFYAMFRTNQKRDGMVCMDMNGKIMWKTNRNPDFDRGSMILADGLILATNGLKGVYLIQPDPTAFKAISSAEILGNGQNWAPIALADGKLLVRDQEKMLCLKVAQ
ncbi:PQQ-like beta-propeller repeat protein [Parabacteroides sp. PF5-9]|uniref:PQQ-like beta-propeller repeat protein n=1 Tax=Parabacteroides sp. PF5-9 TaxID=1742404 RepID=UPI002475AE15|nr:PQQ-like beta-propeller repeat protein [Parabacteroides sp. PF5-9]MDH6356218.1 outer membrane protein assembly factor BamB [Parabacteroides sp. PF5-9]